jgi:hypothetical protein
MNPGDGERLLLPMRILLVALIPLLAGFAAKPASARVPGDIAAAGPRTAAVDLTGYSEIRYVSAAAADDSGDGSRSRPWRSVAAAVARLGGSPSQRVAVLVAAGTYADATVVMREHVDLFGGFSAATWARDIFAHESVLDGRHVRRVVLAANHARLDGFVITRGRALGPGGALLCDGTSPTITNNRLEQSFTVTPAGFRHDRIHQAGHMGGAVACLYESVPVIAHNLFRGNHTEIGEGGALAVWGWHRLPGNPRATIEHNVFVGNTSGLADHARTRSSSGGAVAFSHEASPILRHNIVAQNRAMGRSDAGGLYCEYFSSPTIEHNWIVGNEGDDDGGGLYTMRQGEPLIRHNLFAGNWTTMGGIGGIRISKEGRARIVDNHIVFNQSGGGVYMADGYVVLEGNIIADNRKGPAVRLQQNFPYFQPSRVEGNRFLRNEEGAVVVTKVVGSAPVQKDNQVKDGPARAPAARWTITRARFDPRRGQTSVEVAGAPAPAPGLAGATVWTGTRWGVIATVAGNTLMVWGDLAPGGSAAELFLLPEYP